MPHDNYHLTQCHSQIGDTHRRSEWNASCAAQPLCNIPSSHSFSLFLFLPCLACSQPLCNDLCALILALFLMSTEGERFFSQIGRNAGSPFSCVSSLSLFISMSFCSRRRMKYVLMRSLFFFNLYTSIYFLNRSTYRKILEINMSLFLEIKVYARILWRSGDLLEKTVLDFFTS